MFCAPTMLSHTFHLRKRVNCHGVQITLLQCHMQTHYDWCTNMFYYFIYTLHCTLSALLIVIVKMVNMMMMMLRMLHLC